MEQLIPAGITKYRNAVAALTAELEKETPGEGGALDQLVRDLLDHVTVFAQPNEKGFTVELYGYLAALCGLDGVGMSSVSGFTGSDTHSSGDRW